MPSPIEYSELKACNLCEMLLMCGFLVAIDLVSWERIRIKKAQITENLDFTSSTSVLIQIQSCFTTAIEVYQPKCTYLLLSNHWFKHILIFNCLSSSLLSLYNGIYAYDLKNNVIPLKKICQHSCSVLGWVIFFFSVQEISCRHFFRVAH